MKDISMMTPTEVAFEYDGDKRKIAQAVQNGVLPPTVAALAGIFIDRTLQSNLQQPKTTVYQDLYGAAEADDESPEQTVLAAGGGLMGLPVPDDMFPDEGYASGGIVAFAGPEGSFVETPGGLNVLAEEAEGKEDPQLALIKKFIEQRRRLRDELPSEATEARRKYYEGAGERSQRLSDQQLAMAGLGAAGALLSTRGGVGKALAEAEKAARPSLERSLQAKDAGEKARIEGLAELEKEKRTELGEDIKGAEGLAGKIIERQAARDTDAKAQVAAHVATEKEKIAAGLRKPASDAALANEGWNIVAERLYGPRADQAAAAALRSRTDVQAQITKIRDSQEYQSAKRIVSAFKDKKNLDTKQQSLLANAQATLNTLDTSIAALEKSMGRSSATPNAAPSGGGGGGWSIKPIQ